VSGRSCPCPHCGELSEATVRNRSVGEAPHGKGFSYRHHAWRCSGCGREWQDDVMRRTNEVNVSLFLDLKH
jgi:hypothetical protein